MSLRDCIHGFRWAVAADLPENPLTVNLVSANRERYLSLTETMRSLDYAPRDDSSAVLDG
jgi:L-arabinose 1-dehydrogenase [NAD(P)+]